MKSSALLAISLFVLLNIGRGEKLPTEVNNKNSIAGNSTSRIILGKPAEPAQFPWQVIIFTTDICGGALISNKFVLTAAQCIIDQEKFYVYLGSVIIPPNVDHNRVSIETTDAFYHPNFDRLSLYNDVGLIKLSRAVAFNPRIRAIRLASPDNYLGASEVVIASGWGRTTESSPALSNVLNYVELITIPNTDCEQVYGERVVAKSLCSRGLPTHNTCDGDVGGPLVLKNSVDNVYTHVGIISYFHSDCFKGYPTIYSRTSTHRDWIDDILAKHEDNNPSLPPGQSTTPDTATSYQRSQFLLVMLSGLLALINASC